MSRTALSHHLVKFQQDEEKMVLSVTDDSDREAVMEWYHKSKIKPEDMLREYTPAEVRELCERTKVRVKMYDMNSAWDAKRRLVKEERLENRSESWVNRMLVKAESRKWVLPYSKLEKEKYKVLAACQTKKDNNIRLDRWHRQRAQAAKSSDVEHRAESSSSSASRSKPAESQTQESPESNLLVEQSPATLESQPQAEVDEATMEQSPATLESQPQAEVDEATMEQSPTTLESKSKSDKGTMDENIQPVLQRRPNSDSEPNLLGWDNGDQDEVEEAAEAGNDMQPDGVDSFNWLNLVGNINSENLSLPNTQALDESDDEPFL